MIVHNLIRPESDNDSDKEALSPKDTTGKKRPGFSDDGYIINQKQLNSRYGRGTSADNGCGWISAHNVLKALGDDHKPYDVMTEVENGALLSGTSGTDPLYLVRYFRRKGYDANIYFTKEKVEREILKADASIYVYGYLNPRIETETGEITPANIGAHFVACYPTGDPNHPLRIFNDGEDRDYYYVGGIQDIYRNNIEIFRFIIAINK